MFEAEILHTGQGGHVVVVPTEATAALSSRRAAVIARVNGAEYESKLMVWGGRSYLGLRKDFLSRIGAAVGDQVRIELAQAPEPEEALVEPVTEPPELLDALTANPAAHAAYDRLPLKHQREYLRWILESKDAPTRRTRITRMLRRITA